MRGNFTVNRPDEALVTVSAKWFRQCRYCSSWYQEALRVAKTFLQPQLTECSIYYSLSNSR
jgi:hypothetical protein